MRKQMRRFVAEQEKNLELLSCKMREYDDSVRFKSRLEFNEVKKVFEFTSSECEYVGSPFGIFFWRYKELGSIHCEQFIPNSTLVFALKARKDMIEVNYILEFYDLSENPLDLTEFSHYIGKYARKILKTDILCWVDWFNNRIIIKIRKNPEKILAKKLWSNY